MGFFFVGVVGLLLVGCGVWCRWEETGWLEVYGLAWVDSRVAMVGYLYRSLRCGTGWIRESRHLPDRSVVYFMDPEKIHRVANRWVVTTDSVWVPPVPIPPASGVYRAPDGTWWLVSPEGLIHFDSAFHETGERIPGGRLLAFRGDTMIYVRRENGSDQVVLRIPGASDTVLFSVDGLLRRITMGPGGRIYGAFGGAVFRREGDSLRFFAEGYDVGFLGDTVVVITGQGWVLMDTGLAVLDTVPPPEERRESRFSTLCDAESEWRWDLGPSGFVRCLPNDAGIEVCRGSPQEGWVCADSIHLHDLPVYAPPHPPM